jgi:hypothetical protein
MAQADHPGLISRKLYHSYGRALRGVGDRLLGVACVLLRRGMLFDPDYGSSAAA